MNTSQSYRAALFLLVLLVSHEGITLANNIRQTKILRKNVELQESLQDLTELANLDELDSSFLETENRQGMTGEAYATYEMKEIHKSLKEGFGFENSPVLEELQALEHIPYDRLLTEAELRSHRGQVSSLLEKAMSVLQHNNGISSVNSTVKKLGKCKKVLKNVFGRGHFYRKTSVCRSDPHNPCKGECVCATSGLKECKCKALDLGRILRKSKKIDNALDATDVIGPALFGLLDGFLSGSVNEFKKAFEDKRCQNGKNDLSRRLKRVIKTTKSMWFAMKSAHKKLWNLEGRTVLRSAIKEMLRSVTALIKRGLKFMWNCPATKMLVVVMGVVAVMLILNIAMVAIGWAVVPLIIKYFGMMLGLFYSGQYIWHKAIRLKNAIVAKSCDKTCKIGMVEDSFSLIGAFLEIILMSGLDKILNLDTKVVAPFFDQFGIRWKGKFRSDIQTLRKISKQGKKFAKQIGKTVAAKWVFKSTASDFVSEFSSPKSNVTRSAFGAGFLRL